MFAVQALGFYHFRQFVQKIALVAKEEQKMCQLL